VIHLLPIRVRAVTDSLPPSVSLVIPGRNCARTIRACLDAVVPLLGQDGLNEIIFVDDASTDDTAEIVRQYPVRYIVGDGRGRGSARNIGWRTAESPLVWFIDSDCVAEPDALRLLLPHLDDSRVAGVGGSYGNMRPDSLLACLIHEEIVSRHLTMPREVNYLATFNVLYRREVLEQAGGFAHLARGQDIELAYRIHEFGHRMRFEVNSRVKHFHPVTWTSYLWTQGRHGYFRVWLYVNHPARAKGDSYSGFSDHVQPPLAMLMLASLPLLAFSRLCWAPLLVSVLLLLTQIPMTYSIVGRTGRARYLTFALMSTFRAFARGIGLAIGTCHVLLTRAAANPIKRPDSPSRPQATSPMVGRADQACIPQQK
jgi:cellulose synthase/poly-beta-1,6-N-acetylglucosamine synthase-like glycosyltransferase